MKKTGCNHSTSPEPVLKTDKLADSVLAERVGCTKITHSKVVPEDARHQVDSGVRT